MKTLKKVYKQEDS